MVFLIVPKSPFDSLVRDGVLTREVLASATKSSTEKQMSVGWILVNEHRIPLDVVGNALSAFYRVPFLSYRDDLKSLQEFPCLPLDLCVYYRVAPIARENNRLVLLMDDPGDLPRKDDLEILLSEPFGVLVALKEDIMRLLTGREPQPYAPPPRIVFEAEPETERGVDLAEEGDSGVVVMLNTILLQCHQKKGKEIRFDPRQSPPSAWLVDGEWKDLLIPDQFLQHLVRRLKVMSNLDIGNRAKPQNGFFQLQLFQSRVRFEVSVEPIGDGNEAARVVPGA